MTLDDYLQRESPFFAHRQRWWRWFASLSLGFLFLLPVLLGVAPDGIQPFVPLVVGVGYLTAIGFFEHSLTKRLSRRYGLVCPHCESPYTVSLRRRVGQLLPVTLCPRCRQPVVEPEGSESDATVSFLPLTRKEYERREFIAALERSRSRPPDETPPAPAQVGPLPGTPDDYFRREVAYDRDKCRWYLGWVIVFFASLFLLVLLNVALERGGIAPSAVCGAITMVFLFSSLPS